MNKKTILCVMSLISSVGIQAKKTETKETKPMREALRPLQHNIKPGIYKHYSGSLYEVIGTARHSETLEELVIYRDVNKPELLWARPASMFLEITDYNGTATQRFTLVENN